MRYRVLTYLYVLCLPLYSFSIFLDRDFLSLWVSLLIGFLLFWDACLGRPMRFHRSLKWLLLTMVIFAISSAVTVSSPDPGFSPIAKVWAQVARLAYCSYIFVIFQNVISSNDTLTRVMQFQIAFGNMASVWGICQVVMANVLGGGSFLFPPITNLTFQSHESGYISNGRYLIRATACFPEPSWFGYFLVGNTMLIIAKGLSSEEKDKVKKNTVSLILHLVGILTTMSMGAFIVLAVSVLLMLLYHRGRQTLRAVFGRILPVTAIVTLLILVSPLRSKVNILLEGRFEELAGVNWSASQQNMTSTTDRLDAARIALDLFVEHPLLGVGAGNYGYWYNKLGGWEAWNATPAGVQFTLLAEVGILGLAAFSTFIAVAMKTPRECLTKDPHTRAYFWSAVSLLIFWFGLTDWYDAVFWFQLTALVVSRSLWSETQPHASRRAVRGVSKVPAPAVAQPEAAR